MSRNMLDELDFLLMDKLIEDGRKSIAQIARELGQPTATVRDRKNRLERLGVIQKYTAVIDTNRIGFPVKAIIHLSTSEAMVKPEEFVNALGEIPEVTSVDLVTGPYEAIVDVRLRDIDHLRRILYEEIHKVPWVTGTNTSIVVLERDWKIPRHESSREVRTGES